MFSQLHLTSLDISISSSGDKLGANIYCKHTDSQLHRLNMHPFLLKYWLFYVQCATENWNIKGTKKLKSFTRTSNINGGTIDNSGIKTPFLGQKRIYCPKFLLCFHSCFHIWRIFLLFEFLFKNSHTEQFLLFLLFLTVSSPSVLCYLPFVNMNR